MLWLIVRIVVGTGALAGLAYWAKRRAGGTGPLRRASSLRVVSRLGVAKGASVVRVAVGDRDLLLGCTSQSITTLAELPASPVPGMAPGARAAQEQVDMPGLGWGASSDQSFVSALRSAIKGRAGQL